MLTGFAFGEGGIARPNLGVLAPPALRPPGIGGRSKGAGDDILGREAGSLLLTGYLSISMRFCMCYALVLPGV